MPPRKDKRPAAPASKKQLDPPGPVSQGSPTEPNSQDNGRSFPIVGVGASAGGLEALSQMLGGLPADTGMAFVLIPHLAPTHVSMMAEILGRAASMPVTEVQDEPVVQPNRIYVIPPDRNMFIAGKVLKLLPRGETARQHRPVDFFLRSLAQDQGHQAIGVVLSGSATDGTLGLEEIKAEGGITFAQDDSARQTSMPRSAVASGCVDFVLSPEGIAKELVRIARHPYVAEAPDAEPGEPGSEPHLRRVLQVLRRVTGVDFSHYKGNTLQRRIARRMLLHKLDAPKDYLHLLQGNRAEVEALYQDILISVTSFFRDADAFETLKSKVFPRMTEDRSRHEPARIWVLGCSTGEEAYSLAMAFTEFAEATGTHVPVQIFATDLNAAGIDAARVGVYPKNVTQDISPERLRRFFIEADGHYRISKTIRDLCVFARHNALTDPPFSRVDLISCRNLLIYLNQALQQKVMPILHYALKDPGFLWLGSSETIGTHRDLFEVADVKHKIYAKKRAHTRFALDYEPGQVPPPRTGAAPNQVRARDEAGIHGLEVQKEAERLLLARYTPPSVVIDADMEILQFRGDTGPYLTPAPGKPSLNVLKMAREGLLVGLRGAIHKARKEEAPVREENLHVKSNGGFRDVNLEVIPLRVADGRAGCLLVLFEEPNQAAPARGTPTRRGAKDAGAKPRQEAAERQIERLEQELAATREYLQSVIEQQEAANEELQSANEEVQSANEELQSVNEELETSKEEIQSSNEELATVNDELQSRNLELTQNLNDFTNLMNSVQVAVVMLNRDLRIRQFTPAAEKLLNLIPGDVGRSISDININLTGSELAPLLHEVVDSVTVKELDVQDKQGRWYILHLRPYRTLDNRIEGAVLVLVNIDKVKRAQLALQESEERHRLLVEGASEFAIMMLDPQGRVMSWNAGAQRVFGYSEREIIGESFSRFFVAEDITAGEPEHELEQARGGTAASEDRWLVRQDRSRFWATGATTALHDGAGKLRGYSKVVRDASEKKRLEEDLHRRVEELAAADRSKNEFLAMLAHELRNPLAPLCNMVELLKVAGNKPGMLEKAQPIMEHQLRNLSRMVDDLLDVARVTQGKVQLRKEVVELAPLVESAVDATRRDFEARGQKLTVALPPRPVRLEADATRVEQICVNLLENASKFSEQGGCIWCSAELADGDAKQVVIRVRDEGIGIAPETLHRLFDLFAQGDRSLARTHGGLGIGLTMVRSLVELHGGSVEAHSDGLGQGSEFIVRLPILTANAKMPAPRAEAAAAAPVQARRVLVVDDNTDAAESLAILLRLTGHEVHTAHTGPAALEVAEAKRPQIVVLDIGLPGMDGFEVARRLRDRPDADSMLLIALTGYGQEDHRRQAQLKGFDHHFTKPANLDELSALIARYEP